ncbi:Mannose-1-phosphate guanylyltransferase (GDP) [Chthoniobacter flavus Ellin428]|uniref:mannose-1-phosphate guanylyltransferase n=1 Tax=Chthoniobacter flavus Ellin428 TaxID=497964 RepID=B4D9U1_9BACT|nr:sugar phosphate nucleotidyltransferase [Chthoniobacter flavus]EDY16872.1 Mannose-1-phosphate guanylyltransferase (GDP) [Chthoniobacter flavus Ellin428]TCO93306.1 mannose-6-phosphate isomerase type 2 [Chthoniobacter flavus]
MAKPLYVLILAGGSGERFWPLSRKSRPKQLLSLFSQETLLEATLRRLDGLVPANQILILTNADQESSVRALCPSLPKENIIAEPAKRDTAAAIALGAGWIAQRMPDATMIVLPADHVIKDTASFQRTLRVAAAAAEETGELVTIGIKPTWACPGFGYIEQGAPLQLADGPAGPPVFEVVRFREKPNAELAESFLAQGHFRWNAGMFIWTIRSILSAFQRHAPELGEFISRLHAGEDFAAALRNHFPQLPKISIDYAIMEKATRVLVVEAAFDWDDVGGWAAVAKYLKCDDAGNHGNCDVKMIDATNNIVFTSEPRTVALLGVSDLIVVQTPDAILVCNRHEAEKIKQLVAMVPPELQ